MNWSLLLPSTWNLLTAIKNLFGGDSQITSRALSDVFILTTIALAFLFGLWALWLTVASWMKTGRYLALLPKDENPSTLAPSSDLPLFRELKHHLISIRSRDGTERSSLRRTVDAAEVFRDSALAPSFTTSRFFLAMPGILTGLGVLGTFVGLQMGIGGLDLKDLTNLEKSIIPLIQGCAIAFSTSVWGVFSSLAFSGLEKGLEGLAIGRIRKLQNRVDGLIPRYVPEEAMNELARTSRGTEELLKGLAVAIGDEMQKAIGRLGKEIKDAVANATSEGQGPLMERSVELLSTALTAELAKLKEQVAGMGEQFSGTSEKLSASVRDLDPTVKALSETVSTGHRAVANAVEKLNAHESVMEQMAAASTEVRQAAEAFMTMKETLQQCAARNEDAAQAQLSAAQANTQVAETFGHIGERLPEIRQTLEDAARVVASISGPIADLKTYLDGLPAAQEEFDKSRARSEDDRNAMLLKMSGDLAEKVGQAAEQFSKVRDLADKLNAAATSLDEASNELAVFGRHVLDASKEQRTASEAARAAALSGERTASALAPLPAAFSELKVGLETAGTGIERGAKAACDAYGELVTLQRQWFSGVELGLKAMKDRLQEIIKAYGDQVEGQTRNLMSQWTKEVADCLKTYESQVDELRGDLDELQSVLSSFRRS
jgi:ABC-type transporter Mla subunit MlaD